MKKSVLPALLGLLIFRNSDTDRLSVSAGSWIRLYTAEGASALVKVLGF